MTTAKNSAGYAVALTNKSIQYNTLALLWLRFNFNHLNEGVAMLTYHVIYKNWFSLELPSAIFEGTSLTKDIEFNLPNLDTSAENLILMLSVYIYHRDNKLTFSINDSGELRQLFQGSMDSCHAICAMKHLKETGNKMTFYAFNDDQHKSVIWIGNILAMYHQKL